VALMWRFTTLMCERHSREDTRMLRAPLSKG
jgi:hypothetical protein